MEDELKQYLQGMEKRLNEHLSGQVDASEARMRDFIRESNHNLETRMLAEFREDRVRDLERSRQ